MARSDRLPRQSVTIRFERETRRRLASVARRRGRTASDIVRAAVESWLATEDGLGGASPYDGVADLVGCVRSRRRRRRR